jgi:hypothetical protein
LLQRDAREALDHYGRTPYWAGAFIMLIAAGMAASLHAATRESETALNPEH